MPQKINQKDLFQNTIKELYHSLKGIGSYPADHPASIEPIKKTYQMVKKLLKTHDKLTTSVVNNTLLVEDIPINSKYDFSSKLIGDLTNRKIASFSFSRALTQSDLKHFLMMISKQPDNVTEGGGIGNALKKKGISSIKVDEIKYVQVSDDLVKKQDLETMDYPVVNEVDLDRAQDPFLDQLESNAAYANDILDGNARLDSNPYDPVLQKSEEIDQTVIQLIDKGSDFDAFRNSMASILAKLDKKELAQMSEYEAELKGKKTEMVESLINEYFYSTVAENYVLNSLQIGKYNKDYLRRFLPTEEQRKKATPYIEKKLKEYGRPDDILTDEQLMKSKLYIKRKLEGYGRADEIPAEQKRENANPLIERKLEGYSRADEIPTGRTGKNGNPYIERNPGGYGRADEIPAGRTGKNGNPNIERNPEGYGRADEIPTGRTGKNGNPYIEGEPEAYDGTEFDPRIYHHQTNEPFIDGPTDLTLEGSEEISIREVEGESNEIEDTSDPETDYLTRHSEEIKEKITELLASGKTSEAKSILDHYSQRLDDKSWQIRKSVAEGFHSILSGLDEFDQLKEDFRHLSNTYLNKLTERLKHEDHIDSYLAITETYQAVCTTQQKKEKYFVDETLGHRLYSEEKITKTQLQQVLTTRKANKKSMQYNVAALNYTNENTLLHYLADQFKGFSMLNVSELKGIPNNILETIPVKYAKRYYSLPFKLDDQRLFTALENPRDMEKISDLEFISGYSIVPFAAAEFHLMNAIERFYNLEVSSNVVVEQVIEEIRQEDEGLEYIEEKEEERTATLDEFEGVQGPIVKLVNVILKESVSKGASDIHIEPYENELRVRFRVDGTLTQMMTPPYKYKNGIASRLKIMSRLNISEKRLPQDGRFKIKTDGKCVDFRVSTFPGTYGETVVLRLLDKSNLEIDISKLGMEKEDINSLTGAMYKSKGMILVTGPTGSGKTTSLYSMLQKLNDGSRNINTAEDPVEYNIQGINQFQMNPRIGLNFAMALRSFLRQDPDIIMVGEMRDLETAEIAVKAALTGHLVLSTLHTNSSFETITRLLEMGIEPFLVATSVDLIIAQRLMRKICPACKKRASPPEMHLEYLKKMGLKVDTTKFYAGKGCAKCNHTGYKGRFAIYEVLPMYHEIREMIINRESSLKIQERAEKMGVKTLQNVGISKVLEGITTIDELMRVAI
ncbi:MAG: GspE/PulE family protein [bacterium]